MKISRLMKKKSIVFKWLTSYLILFMLVLSINVFIYLGMDTTLKTEINDENTFMLNATLRSMDNVLKNVKNISVELSKNSDIQHISLLKGKISNPDYFYVYRIATDLNHYSFANNNISSIYIMFKDYNQVITADGIFSLRDFYRNYYSESESDFHNWMNEFNTKIPQKYFTLYMDKLHQNDNKLNYVKPLSSVEFSNLSFSSGIVINEKILLKQLSNIDKITQGTSFIIDSKDNIIAGSPQSSLMKGLDFKDLIGKSGVEYKSINTKKVVISYISSKQADWKYVIVTPRSFFYRKLNFIRYITLLGLIVCSLMSTILIYYFLKKNYNPVNKLLEILKDKTKFEGTDSNEYVLIEKAIEQTLLDNYTINNKLLNQKVILKDNFLEKLLKGGDNGGIPIEEGISAFDISFQSNYFAVITFLVNDSADNIKALNDYFGNSFNAFNFILSNVIVELVDKKNKALIIKGDTSLTYLINFCQDRIFFAKSDMINAMIQTKEFIQKYYNINISFSISGVHENIENIPIAYNESLYAMNYKTIMGIKENIYYDDINKNTFIDTYYYPLNKEHQLLNYIKLGNYNAASKIIDEVFSKNIKAGMTVELAQCLMLNMVSTMIRAVNDVSNIEQDTFLQDLSPINQLLCCKTLNQMKNQLDDFLELFCLHVSKTIEKSTSWVVNRVIPYIQQNYYDPNLSLEQIGEQFNVHPVYVSKVFKDHVGKGVLDYINNLRIEHSKLLLEEKKNATIEQIAELVGYQNVRTFSRVFKKYTNISPGKYRNESL